MSALYPWMNDTLLIIFFIIFIIFYLWIRVLLGVRVQARSLHRTLLSLQLCACSVLDLLGWLVSLIVSLVTKIVSAWGNSAWESAGQLLGWPGWHCCASPNHDAFPPKGREQAYANLQPVSLVTAWPRSSPPSGRPSLTLSFLLFSMNVTDSILAVITDSWTLLLITGIFLIMWPKQGSSRIARTTAETHFPAVLLSSMATLPILVGCAIPWCGAGPTATHVCRPFKQPQWWGSQHRANALCASSPSLQDFLDKNMKP